MKPMRYRGWIVAAAALALIGAPQLRGYCLTACNAADVDRVEAQAEVASPSSSCHHSGETPSGNPSSNPRVPGHGGCCDHASIVQGTPASAEPTHPVQVAAVARYPAVSGAGLGREETSLRSTSAPPKLFRSPGVLRL